MHIMSDTIKAVFIVLITVLPAYALGNVNGAIMTSKYLYKKDIREYGSGNPGLTNFYRVFGKSRALLVVLIDVAKTVAPVLLGGFLFNRYYEAQLLGRELAGLFVILGHCFPALYKFKGGKGIMAAGTILIVLDWRIALISWGVFILISIITRYVSLGSVIGVALFPVFQIIFKIGGPVENAIAIACAAIIILRHHANISRLFKGEESKFIY